VKVGKDTSSIIIDPVYGQIELFAHERELIEKDFLQRLKHIKQLGVAFYAYPAATHTRLEHSLGVMHVAGLIYGILTNEEIQTSNIENIDTPEARQLVSKIRGLVDRLCSENHECLVRIAALLHDSGHGPFSHSLELVLTRNPALKITKEDLEGLNKYGEVKAKVGGLWDRYVPKELNGHEDFTVVACLKNRDEIEEVLVKLPPSERLEFEDILKILTRKTGNDDVLSILSQIVSSDVDADRIDYLLRDTYHAGFSHSGIELYSLVRQLRLNPLHRNGEEWWTIGVPEDGVLFVEGLLIARKYHYDRISMGEDSRRYEIFLVRRIEQALAKTCPEQRKEKMCDFFIDQKDENVIAFIEEKNHNRPFQEIMNEATKYGCVLEAKWRQFTAHDHYDLLMVWRNDKDCKEFTETIEKELKKLYGEDFVADVYFHGKFPTSLLMSATPGYLFLYDYSSIIGDFPALMLENGGIRIYAKKHAGRFREYASMIERGLFSRNRDERRLLDVLRDQLEKTTTRRRGDYLVGCPGSEQRCRNLDMLMLLFYSVHYHLMACDEVYEEIADELRRKYGDGKADAIRQAIDRRKETLGIRTTIYRFISSNRNLFGFSYDLRDISGPLMTTPFTYSSPAHEDIQTLNALGFLDEKRVLQRPPEVKKGVSWRTPMYTYTVNKWNLPSYVNDRPQLKNLFDMLQGKMRESIRSIVLEEVERMLQ